MKQMGMQDALFKEGLKIGLTQSGLESFSATQLNQDRVVQES
jgi:hypothetical protein